MRKQTTVTLTFPEYYGDDRVEQITDSVAYAPGQVLPREVVERLCRDDTWKIVMKQRRDRD